ncbi:MAG: sigma-70 family RNA polymerase sigma factor [Planctomycetes bacterium]|nr:sigma-70 family RNA polymerase sigma factor [Planctomycetota bacterium]MCB9872197.1 sigma-70 family RNA polymerase sigma factor [Planctomycetota bacterium]
MTFPTIPMVDPTRNEIEAFAALVAAAQRGEAGALDAVLRRVYPRVQQLVHRQLQRGFRPKNPWLRPMFSTGDVVQDVFLGVLSTAPNLEGQGEDAVVRYLASAVQNRLLDMMRYHGAARRDARRRADQTSADAFQPPSSGAAPWRSAAVHEKLGIYLDVLESFPRRHRLLLRRRIEQGNSFAAIAEELGFPSSDAARKAFHEAHAKLLVRLVTRGVKPESNS